VAEPKRWNDFINKIYGSQPEPEEDNMDELLKKYNVKSVEELDIKIEEHCGTDFDGGFLGSEREKNKKLEIKVEELEKEIEQFQEAIVGQKHHIIRLESELSDCKTNSGDNEWEINGKEVTTIEGNVTTKLNYKKVI